MHKLMQVLLSVGMVVLAGCSADESVPSCQQAFDHFYAADCTLVDATTRQPIPKDTSISNCVTVASEAPLQCKDELHAWLRCFNEVTSPAMNDADCSCMAEQTALFSCQ